MPLSSDLGLVYNEDLFAIRVSAHWVKLKVKVEVSEGLYVFWWPATKVHVS